VEKLPFLGQNREGDLHVQSVGTAGLQQRRAFSLSSGNPHRDAVFPSRTSLGFTFHPEMPADR